MNPKIKTWLVWPVDKFRPNPAAVSTYETLDPERAILYFLEDEDPDVEVGEYYVENVNDPAERYLFGMARAWTVSDYRKIDPESKEGAA
jgi:hypothetical protein